MSMRNDLHLDEEQLLCAIVEESDLLPWARDHLSSCLSCRAEKERIEGSLARMSRKAERFAPLPTRKVVVPPEPVGGRPWLWLQDWKWTFTAGVTAAMAVVVTLGSLMFTVKQDRNAANLYREMLDDERLITEVGRLEENALPSFYLEISEGAADQDLDEDFQESGVRAPEHHAQSERSHSRRG
jgi:hypothetical protein